MAINLLKNTVSKFKKAVVFPDRSEKGTASKVIETKLACKRTRQAIEQDAKECQKYQDRSGTVNESQENRTIEIDSSQIAARAEEIWYEEGCPDGRAEKHWQQAEQELRKSY